MFPDFPFDAHLPSFLPHQSVQNYLERYSTNFAITPHIKVLSKISFVYSYYSHIYSYGRHLVQSHSQTK